MRIGLVLVHGVGEQRRFDHLCAEVRNLVAALATVPNLKVTVETRNTQDSETGAPNETWRADGSAPVKIHIEHELRGDTYVLALHEVWWADLDDKETLWNRIKFWLWGLGFWGVKKFADAKLQGGQLDMQPPVFPDFTWVDKLAARLGKLVKWGGRFARWCGNFLREIFVRARLWTFANVFLLSALTVNVVNYVLRQLRLGQLPLPGIEVFYQFVGDVKLYQDRGKPQLGPITDLGDPRRVAIRRRIVQVLVDAYRADYDRWYVLAHSLGSVVAVNGLMETAHALPNYLSRETWASLKAAKDPVLGPRTDGRARTTKGMRPARPAWIADDNEVLHRDVLFAKLRGLVTYGSPLDKFAYLWCQIVNINNDTTPWQVDNGKRTFPFEWVNVFEHTDPVSAGLHAYRGGSIPPTSPAPTNLAYKASWVLLLSHLKYLQLRRRGDEVPQDQFVLRLLVWLLDGKAEFQKPTEADRNWYRNPSFGFGLLLRTPMWIVLSAVLTAALGYLAIPAILEIVSWLAGLPLLEGSSADEFFRDLERSFAGLSLPERMLGVLIVGASIVTLAGGVRRFLEREPRNTGAGR